MGVSNAVCLDFDFAIRALKRWADKRADETELVRDERSDEEKKRQARMVPVPRFKTLRAVLGLDGPETDDPEARDRIDDMVAQMMTVPSSWTGMAP